MWYPNRWQWLVIWIAGLLLCYLIVASADFHDEVKAYAEVVLILSLLLVWSLNKRKS
jgi:hypothetical protein